ncbi:MAG: cupin domain-containing protein [Chitinophagaceae bacterium]
MAEPIKNIKPKMLVPGITGYYAHGDQMSFGFVELEAGASIPLHHHPQEQITYIIDGELEMQIGDEECTLRAGMYHVIPGNMPHSAIARSACTLLDAFSPAREDYRV